MKKQTLCLPGLHFPLSKGNQVMVFDKTSEAGGVVPIWLHPAKSLVACPQLSRLICWCRNAQHSKSHRYNGKGKWLGEHCSKDGQAAVDYC